MSSAAVPLKEIEWGECLVPPALVQPALEADMRRRFGVVPGWLVRVAHSAWVPHAFAEMVGKPVCYAEPALCDLISLVVSQDNSCRYCYGAQRTVLKILGYREDFLVRLERDSHVLDLPAGERAALDLARRVSRANPPPRRAELDEVAAAGLAPPAVREVVAAAAVSVFNNRVATLLALPPERDFESMVERPLFRLMRPLVAWKMRGKRRAPEPPPAGTGPCSAIVVALGDSPAAGALRRMIDAAWASEVLPRRTKVLLLAVVGKALGCAFAESEARDLLAAEDMTPGEVDRILTDLASPRLDAHETRLVPFARETVRYQPAVIQRRMREVCEGFTPAEVVETAGILSLANAVCRMGVLVEAC